MHAGVRKQEVSYCTLARSLQSEQQWQHDTQIQHYTYNYL